MKALITFQKPEKKNNMFEGREFPKSLAEETFNGWLEKGRLASAGAKYLLVIWDEYESTYRPVYAENREEITEYRDKSKSYNRERLVAAYDLYSESRLI